MDKSDSTFLGYTYNDSASNYRKCFITSLHAQENHVEGYHRLEYLGDRQLKAIQGEYLYKKFPNDAVGQLTIKQTLLEDKIFLGDVLFHAWGLQESDILMGTKYNQPIHRQSAKLKSNIVESIIGGIFVDSNYSFDILKQWCINNIYPHMDKYLEHNSNRFVVTTTTRDDKQKLTHVVSCMNEFFMQHHIPNKFSNHKEEDNSHCVNLEFTMGGKTYNLTACGKSIQEAKSLVCVKAKEEIAKDQSKSNPLNEGSNE